MHRIIFLSIALFMASLTTAQKESNDPKATAILQQVRDNFNALTQFEMSYRLTLKFPDQPEEVQQGKLLKKGQAFRLNNDLQTVVSDGKTIWVHLKDLGEIQIMDASDESIAGMLDPENFLDEFVEGQFIYGLTFDGPENGIEIQKIEFKTVDPTSEYAKLRLTVKKASKQLVSLESFQKDGSRYSIGFDKLNTSPVIAPDAFRFDPKQYPGVHVEDLRM